VVPRRAAAFKEAAGWSPQDFAREQIRGLVRQVFSSQQEHRVRQVVFSAVDLETDVASVCLQVGKALALETRESIAIVGADAHMARVANIRLDHTRLDHKCVTRSKCVAVAGNLWQVPGIGSLENSERFPSVRNWHARLEELRNGFEYAVIHGPPAGISSEAALLGQLADGIILVVGAHSTRRATALKIKETMGAAQARILGTVLSERTFPIPERIYRRL
jgi:hypothetical protein